MDESMKCGECGQIVSPPDAFHPYFYCRMYRELGISNQTFYLREHGFVHHPEIMGLRPTTAQAPPVYNEKAGR